jgi:hypothetical protein
MGHLSSEKWPAPDAAPNGRPYTSAHLCEFITDGSPVHPLYWAHLSKEVAYGFAKTPPKNGKDRGGLRGLRLLCPRLSPLRHPNLERYHSPGGCSPMRRLRQVRGGVPGYHNYTGGESPMKKRWYDFLWIASLLYLVLGFFNILFAWLGLLCFFIPLVIAFAGGDKGYCNRFCGRGQLFSLLGGRFGLSRRADIPRWMKSKAFRYGFLGFFLLMFFQMLWSTYLVFAGAQELRQAVTLLWTFRLPWHWAYYGTLFSPGVAQFAFGFYSVMLTSTVLGLVTMVLFKPRSWCVYCPMGTMTQLICRGKHRGEAALHSPAQGS